jgi:hypothetical protein
MRISILRVSLSLAIFLGMCAHSGEAREVAGEARAVKAIDRPGRYVSPDGTCQARLAVASMGGFLILTAGGPPRLRVRVEDVTGIAWIGQRTLVYTTSPIYGVPGVYVYECGSGKAERIVVPRTITKANPGGADFFELQRVSTGKPLTIYFYYALDVDGVNFDSFRTPRFLYQVHLDGTGFRRAENPRR